MRNKQLYDNNYRKEHYRNYSVRFRFDRDAEIIDKLDSITNKVEYIRRLIAEDIEAERTKERLQKHAEELDNNAKTL